VRLHRDGQIKSKRDFRVPAAGHFAVTVVDDATNLPVAGVIVRPSAFPQPRFGSTVLSGFFGVSDDNGQLTLDVNPGGSTLSAIFGSVSDYLVTPPVFVDSGATQPVEIRIP
jgi:hypothetical protein